MLQAWYSPGLSWTVILTPLEWLYRCVIKCRFRQRQVCQNNPPIIVVGNITVGGTGKSPVVQTLVNWLQSSGLKAGVLTRGYGAQSAQGPILVEAKTPVALIGDEAKMLSLNCTCPIVVDSVRPRGLIYLQQNCQVDVVICDDGLQHYALPRDFEIVVVDGDRLFGNGRCLPVGPLREPTSRLNSAHLILQNGGSQTVSEDVFSLEPQCWVNLKTGEKINLDQLDRSVRYQAVAAIGHPERFFKTLQSLAVEAQGVANPDHHAFTQDDFKFSESSPVLMTEKDAVKCVDFAKDNWWYLKVSAQLSDAALAKVAKLLPNRSAPAK